MSSSSLPHCHFLSRSGSTVAHFAISPPPQLPRKEGLSLSGPAPAQTVLPVSHPIATCQAPGRAGPGFSPQVLSRLLLQLPPSAHHLWQGGNVAGIRTNWDLTHLPYTPVYFPQPFFGEGPTRHPLPQDRNLLALESSDSCTPISFL